MPARRPDHVRGHAIPPAVLRVSHAPITSWGRTGGVGGDQDGGAGREPAHTRCGEGPTVRRLSHTMPPPVRPILGGPPVRVRVRRRLSRRIPMQWRRRGPLPLRSPPIRPIPLFEPSVCPKYPTKPRKYALMGSNFRISEQIPLQNPEFPRNPHARVESARLRALFGGNPLKTRPDVPILRGRRWKGVGRGECAPKNVGPTVRRRSTRG
jgi:hypothetical protein